LTAHDPALCRSFILVKLLSMLILEDGRSALERGKEVDKKGEAGP